MTSCALQLCNVWYCKVILKNKGEKLSLDQYYRAKKLLLNKEIKKMGEGKELISFKVRSYSVIFKKSEGLWSCTCEHGSLWGGGVRKCFHVIACEMFLGKFEVEKNG